MEKDSVAELQDGLSAAYNPAAVNDDRSAPAAPSQDAWAAATAPEATPEVNVPGYQGPDRRKDRSRREPINFFSFRLLSSRRERKHPGRRYEDWKYPYVDWYEPRYMILAVAIVFLAIADSFFSLALWGRGLIELSAVMAHLVDQSVRLFVGVKITVTCLALTLLVLYKNFSFYKVLRVGHILYLLLFAYALIVINQFLLWRSL